MSRKFPVMLAQGEYKLLSVLKDVRVLRLGENGVENIDLKGSISKHLGRLELMDKREVGEARIYSCRYVALTLLRKSPESGCIANNIQHVWNPVSWWYWHFGNE